ncbi:hypothetical protein FUAX_24300 [Fulvitalea axinellae]|uniref:OmpA-like domain-containing protein n=1 Tax=Fulvitalea axinellae TaxID=1182444 RepID=A0AAU9D228_9BACT|nr:hypothetical protein FUAX_24300 [Fulvitalea axinellae]
MMTNRKLWALAPVLLTLFFSTSCVTQGKYDQLLSQKEEVATESQACAEALEISDEENRKFRARIEGLEKDTARLGPYGRKNARDLAKLRKEHASLNRLYDDLMKNSGKLNQSLHAQQQHLNQTRADLESTRAQNEELARDLAQREKRVNELEKVIQAQKQAAQDLQDRVATALGSFAENDIQIENRNGEVYVSLSDKLLFGSGSIKVDPKGIDALQKLGQVISQQDNFEIVIEGHTDNVAISKPSKYMRDNWDLSVIRATSVARILITEGVEPSFIHAQGRGEHLPKADNDSPENKQLNRRIEIILKPRLADFYQILNKPSSI